MDPAPLRFARPLPALVRLLAVGLFLWMLLWPMALGFGAIDWLEEAVPVLRQPDGWLPQSTIIGSLLAFTALPAALFVLVRTWAAYRYGCCVIAGTTATFTLYLQPIRTVELEIPLDELALRRETDDGLLLERAGAHQRLRPLMVFVRDPALCAQVLARIEGARP